MSEKPDWMSYQYYFDLKDGKRTCGDPLCPDPYCWMDDPEEERERLEAREEQAREQALRLARKGYDSSANDD